MNFLLLVRRTHLYLGLFLLPWVIMFGASSIPINHTYASAPPTWTRLRAVTFNAPVSGDQAALRATGRQMMEAGGVSGGFYVSKPNPTQINVNHPNFLPPIRMMYYPGQQQLVVERREFQARPFLTAMHTRGGYNLDGFWDNLWAVFVDIVSVALLLWMASGLFMWWKLPGTGLRRWGWLALVGGAVSFAIIIARL